MTKFNWYSAWAMLLFFAPTTIGFTPLYNYWVDIAIIILCLLYIYLRVSNGDI